jgi:ABC-2 type transport system ATP-binding protein
VTDAIRTESLTKYFGAVVGVEALTMSVRRGEVYGFLGPNGAGKTTTIRLLLDLLRPTSGRATVEGYDCRADSRHVRSRVGYLPGEMPIYPDMTGEAYLRFLLTLQPGARADGLPALFRRFDVSAVDLRRRMRDLSHGMKRKFGIIQALMGERAVLVLDEPTSGLDPLMTEAFAETIRDIQQAGRTTVFLSSHILSEVERLCDRVGLIRRGHLAREATLADLRRELPRRVRITFTGSAPAVVPPALAAATVSQARNHWLLEWHGPFGDALRALETTKVADVEIDPFKLEDYVLGLYSGEARTPGRPRPEPVEEPRPEPAEGPRPEPVEGPAA